MHAELVTLKWGNPKIHNENNELRKGAPFACRAHTRATSTPAKRILMLMIVILASCMQTKYLQKWARERGVR